MPPGASPAAGYKEVSGPCDFHFPADHASHPDYRAEWWYYTGNLESENGEAFGFQLTFFRVGAGQEKTVRLPPEQFSAWRSDQIFAAHFAISDISKHRFHTAEKMARAALGLAGASTAENGSFKVFVNDWGAEIDGTGHKLYARGPGSSIKLELLPGKPPVAHGEGGYSRKGESSEEASCYYSVTRLHAKGKILVDGRERGVSGTAWMDHEYSSAPLNPVFSGWDWFSIGLSDGSEVMVYLIREKDGEVSRVSSGTYVDAGENARHLTMEDLRVKVLDTWKSTATGATYPSRWFLEVVPLGLRLEITPKLPDQEVQTPETTRITYWEGSVSVKGVSDGQPVNGEGYVELTGYAGAVRY